MKFVADVMLGRLARLMRFQGYDVEYDRAAQDDALLHQSRYRILLTKDRALAKRIRPDRVCLVKNITAEAQLSEICKKFPQTKAVARCLVCNLLIRRIPNGKIKHLVPPFIFSRYQSFLICRNCRRIYWQGTHYQRMHRMIE